MEKIGDLFHLPDLQFAQFFDQRFSVNKGIYNTIDQWFYQMGVTNITERRNMMLQFMLANCSDGKKVKFGSGGLTKKLQLFFARNSRVRKAT